MKKKTLKMVLHQKYYHHHQHHLRTRSSSSYSTSRPPPPPTSPGAPEVAAGKEVDRRNGNGEGEKNADAPPKSPGAPGVAAAKIETPVVPVEITGGDGSNTTEGTNPIYKHRDSLQSEGKAIKYACAN